MLIHGVDVSTLGNPFTIQDCGKILLLDGDFGLYKAAATTKTLPTAVRRLHSWILEEMFLTGCAKCEVFFTDSYSPKCLRHLYPTVKPYQAQRKGKARPPLLDPLKAAVQAMDYREHPEGIVVDWAFTEEADDRMIARSHELLDNCIVSSGDKDLRLTPAPYWEEAQGAVHCIPDRFGSVWWTGEGSTPLKGHGTKFFWAQMLMGDTADNVQGISKLDGKLCGAVAARNFLENYNTESSCADAVVAAYARNKQNVLAEAECLWLRRSEDDSAFAYLMEVVTVPALRDWLVALHDYHKAIILAKQENIDEEEHQEEG